MNSNLFSSWLWILGLVLITLSNAYAKEKIAHPPTHQSNTFTAQALQQAAQAYDNQNQRKELLETLESAGNPFAVMMLNRAYRQKLTGFNNNAQAIAYQQRFDAPNMVKHLKRLAQQGSVDALNWLGNHYRHQESRQEQLKAFNYFMQAAKKENIYALSAIAWMYENGKGVAKDLAQAITWYQKAAQAGNTDAMLSLGFIYEKKLDNTTAMEWYQQAAQTGSADAMFILGAIYQEGKLVAKDLTQAITWYQKAAQAGNKQAEIEIKRLEDFWDCGCVKPPRP